jgi:hypothetical protein
MRCRHGLSAPGFHAGTFDICAVANTHRCSVSLCSWRDGSVDGTSLNARRRLASWQARNGMTWNSTLYLLSLHLSGLQRASCLSALKHERRWALGVPYHVMGAWSRGMIFASHYFY